jgi:hypothetical protein
MLIEFDEEIDLPPERLYAYFRTPVDWARLFAAFGKVEARGDGWYAVSLRSFPFPLVAKITRAGLLAKAKKHWERFLRGRWKMPPNPPLPRTALARRR